MLRTALQLASEGFAVFPLVWIENGQCVCPEGPLCKSVGKHPRIDGGHKRATADPAQIRRWFRKYPKANLGVRTTDGLIVLDVDDLKSLRKLEEEHGPIPETFTVRTGRGGLHYYFRTDEPISNSAGGIGDGLDIRGEGGYVVAPPSMHESGNEYSVEVDVPIAPMPDWLVRLALEERKERSRPAPSTIPEGQRNSTLFREACKLRRAGSLTQDEAVTAIGGMNHARCEPQLSEGEVDQLVQSAFRYAPNTKERLSDAGNARRLARLTQGRLLYVKRLGGWLIYESGRWTRDELNVAQELAKEIPLELYHEVSVTDDAVKRRRILSWAERSEYRARIQATLKLAESIPELVASVDDFDQDPWLLNVLNGVLDLRSGELSPHDPKYRITRLAPVKWLGLEAPCAAWKKHIHYVLGGDGDLVEFMQRALGYSLTGLTTEQKLFVLHGLGANGKSVTLEVLRSVLGKFAAQTPAETLMVKQRGGGTNDIARLRGARLVTAVETELYTQLAEVLVKQMTGGDTVTARYLYHEFFEFQPTFKIWLAVNHKPWIYGTDHAIWRRICLIPFEVTIPASKRKPHMARNLRKEASGILTWLVRGCLRWQKEGLKEPKTVKSATARYREEQDPVGAFLLVCCVRKRGEWATAADLYREYQFWADDVGETPVKKNTFGRMLAERGLEKDRKGPKKAVRWLGLGLREPVRRKPAF